MNQTKIIYHLTINNWWENWLTPSPFGRLIRLFQCIPYDDNSAITSTQHQQLSCIHPHHRPFSHVFCSTKFGVDQSYNTLQYYEENFTNDLQRVQQLFEMARGKDWPLLHVSHLSLNLDLDLFPGSHVLPLFWWITGFYLGRDSNTEYEYACDTVTTNITYSGHYLRNQLWLQRRIYHMPNLIVETIQQSKNTIQ